MPISAHKNFALTTMASPPSGVGGVSLTVATGTGTRFPAVPFNATIWPVSVQPTVGNAEVVRVTAIATDVFTVTRAQEGSSARTFAANDQIAATITARTLTDVEYGAHGVFNVKDPVYGAVGDGTTDDTAAIQSAITAAMAAGGGRITGKAGETYLCVGYSGRSLVVPINGANYASEAQTVNAHFHLVSPENLWFDMPDSTLKTAQSGFNFIVLDGPRNVRIDIGRILTPTAGQVANSTLDVEGLNGIAITSSARDGWNVQIPRLHADHCKTAIYVFGAATSAYRVRGIHIGVVYHEWGSYGIALHNNGDDVAVDSYVSKYVGRPGFLYGVDNVRGHWHSLQRLGGLAFLCKAYDRDLTNLNISYRVVQENTSVDAIGFASEHNVAAQPTPKSVRNVVLNYDDTGSGASMVGIRFQYLVDAVAVGTVATRIFDNFTIRGTMDASNGVTTLVQQTPTGLLDISNLVLSGAPVSRSIFLDGGFYSRIGNSIDTPRVGTGILHSATTTTDATQYGEQLDHRGSSAATTLIIGMYVKTGTVAAAYTAALVHVHRIANAVKGAGSTITKAVGQFYEAQTQGTTNFCWEASDPAIMNGAYFYGGSGTPEGVVTAPVGSLFLRTNGGAGTSMYVKESGAGNTGWIAK